MVAILKMVPMLNIVAILISNTTVIYHGILTLGNEGYCAKLPWYFSNIGTCKGLYYKTFYGPNLRIFVIS
jgi:hypothetical protein